MGRPLSSWCGLITLGFSFLTWKAETEVPAHSRLLGIKSNRITDLKAFFEERSSVQTFLLQPSHPQGTCSSPRRLRGVGFRESHSEFLPALRSPPRLAAAVHGLSSTPSLSS